VKQKLQHRLDQPVLLHAPHQKLLLTQAGPVVEPLSQRIENLRVVGLVRVLDEAPVEAAPPEPLVVLVGYEQEGVDHVAQLVRVQIAISVHVEYFEANWKSPDYSPSTFRRQLTLHPFGGGAPAGRRNPAAQLLEVDVTVPVHVQR
jgi:hypothetical protein